MHTLLVIQNKITILTYLFEYLFISLFVRRPAFFQQEYQIINILFGIWYLYKGGYCTKKSEIRHLFIYMYKSLISDFFVQ